MAKCYWHISWVSEDGQGEILMRMYPSAAWAYAELPRCKAELLEQCLDDDEETSGDDGLMTRSACLAGTWVVAERDRFGDRINLSTEETI